MLISTPDRADIELDGTSVGSTPSTVALSNGDHTVRVSKKGYRLYEKKLRILGGSVSFRVELEVAQWPCVSTKRRIAQIRSGNAVSFFPERCMSAKKSDIACFV
jgi:hypothetical protein